MKNNHNMVRVSDVETFTNALWGSLRSLDLSSCRSISSFPDCRMISDDGLAAIASLGDTEGCSNLELVDLMIRQMYYERALRMGSGDPVCMSDLLFVEKKRREMVNQKTIDTDSDEECEDYQDEADYAM
ncbi:hypothetical protein PsorP6_008791 [Peronosclerospora sorghi]|uniref:Uncharacterized protein n=1 Tax=Peronosclerospora sorghi TaxID=230839 RepID=A0ACC0W0J6_9STRA|nr:hypothetical protein PsorP6_008791 [Peronosclerospora sorghi]